MKIKASSIIQSKKFLAALAASLVSFFAVREGMSFEQIAVITGPFYAYIGGQAFADFGKERAQIESDAPTSPVVVNTVNTEGNQ